LCSNEVFEHYRRNLLCCKAQVLGEDGQQKQKWIDSGGYSEVLELRSIESIRNEESTGNATKSKILCTANRRFARGLKTEVNHSKRKSMADSFNRAVPLISLNIRNKKK